MLVLDAITTFPMNDSIGVDVIIILEVCIELYAQFVDTIILKWLIEYGREDTEKMLECSLGACNVYIRVNTSKTDSDTLIEMLKELKK